MADALRVTTDGFRNPEELATALTAQRYLPDYGLAAAAFLAQRLGRPLFLEGEPGVGKTAFAQALSDVFDIERIRLQCYGGIDAAHALYDWDFPRQVLQLRALAESADPTGPDRRRAGADSVYDDDFLVERPILKALRNSPCVLLIDEIDRADDEFEAFLLEVLESYEVTIPQLDRTIKADPAPLVVLTSNRTREVHDAIKRRCVYHWIAHPDLEREVRIVRQNLPPEAAELAREVAMFVRGLRDNERGNRLAKPPGIAESIDMAKGVLELGADALDVPVVEATMGTVVKHHEDQELLREHLQSAVDATVRRRDPQ
jgi:MoxR-like ATPase